MAILETTASAVPQDDDYFYRTVLNPHGEERRICDASRTMRPDTFGLCRPHHACDRFADHDRCEMGVGAAVGRHDRGVGDAQAGDALHLAVRVDDAVSI